MTAEAIADEYVYVLANCDTVSSSSPYYDFCEFGDGFACGSDMAQVCASYGDSGYDYGAVIEFDSTRYLVCFHNEDGAACQAAANGCSVDVSDTSYQLIFKEDSVTVGGLNHLENMEQLKCCYNFYNPGFVEIGDGVECYYSLNYCREDGTIESEDPYCTCSAGYYSTAAYTYAPGAEYMVGNCLPCEDTVYATGNNTSVNVPPTSDGGGAITSCYLKKGTQGSDVMGLWEIVNGNCGYSN